MGYMIDLSADEPSAATVVVLNGGTPVATYGPFESETDAKNAVGALSSLTGGETGDLEYVVVPLYRVVAQAPRGRRKAGSAGKE